MGGAGERSSIVLTRELLPRRCAGELQDTSDARHLAKLLKASGLECATALDLGLEVPFLERRSTDQWFGVIWVVVTGVVLPVVVQVLTRLINKPDKKTEKPAPTVHIELVLERGQDVAKISYKGDGETLTKVLKGLADGNPPP
jgi:hypothetical protein